VPYVLPALSVTCQQKVKTESYQNSETQIQTSMWVVFFFFFNCCWDHLQLLD